MWFFKFSAVEVTALYILYLIAKKFDEKSPITPIDAAAAAGILITAMPPPTPPPPVHLRPNAAAD